MIGYQLSDEDANKQNLITGTRYLNVEGMLPFENKVADYIIRLPKAEQMLMPMVAAVPLQLIAYYTAVLKGNDVDKPRNLAKSVTVE